MNRAKLLTVIVAVAPLWVACTAPFGDGGPSWLRAYVQGAMELEYTGTGYFDVSPGRDVPIRFTLSSHAVDESEANRLLLVRRGQDRPGVGTCTLAPGTGGMAAVTP